MIKKLGPKDAIDLMILAEKYNDKFKDFYFTKDRERKYFTKLENSKEYLKMTKKGEVCLYDVDYGIILTWGMTDKRFRTYLKLAFNSLKQIKQLIRAFLWKYGNKDLYIKIKINNSLRHILPEIGFIEIKGERGNDVLFYRKAKSLSKIDKYILEEKELEY